MSLRATATAAVCIAALGVSDLADQRAAPWDRDQTLKELRKMIAPSPDAERDYAIALEIWQRENGAVPAAPRPGAPAE